MKVFNINSIGFKGSSVVSNPEERKNEYNKIKELGNITPDFAVKTPQKYYKIGVTELPNGIKTHSYKLANGYRITIVPMEGSPATVKNYVNVGALNETDDIKGISHFLEHMAFNGTTGEQGYLKLNQGDSFKKIDVLGGWTNASTSLSMTDYVNSTPLLEEKDIEEQIKIIAAMTEDLALTDEMIEKEKGPVCSEINMIMDRPSTIGYDQAIRTLFNIKSSADELIAGSSKHIQNLTRNDIKNYYDKYYTPDNMNLVITGEVNPDEIIEIVAKNFHSKKIRKGNVYHEKLTPINRTVRKDFISDKTKSTGAVLAFTGPENNDIKSKIIFEIIQEYIGSVNSGFRRDLKPLNTMVSTQHERISNKPTSPTMLAFGFDTTEENSEKALKVVYNKLSNLKAPSDKDLSVIKKRLIKDYNTTLEYSGYINNVIGTATFDGGIEYLTKYPQIINEITADDINEFINKYIDINKAAITLVHPKTDIDTLLNNHKSANNISFKGSARKPLKEELISETTLENNFKMGFIETNNNNVNFKVQLSYDIPKDINPAAFIILDDMLSRGTANKTEEEFDKLQEDKNIELSSYISATTAGFRASSTSDNIEDSIKYVNEILRNPRINEEEFQHSVDRVKDYLKRSQPTAEILYDNYIGEQSGYLSNKKLKEGIESVTIEDVKKLHKYILENSCGTIAMNIPSKNKDVKNIAIQEFSKYNNINPYEIKIDKNYQENITPIVLTKAEKASQADIKQVYRTKSSDDLKDKTTLMLLNSLLSSSSSISLFNTLREKEQLAYSVYSDLREYGDTTEISLNILTTTDNKDTGEVSFENLQKSIKGFHRQINCLINSEFSDEDLESAKKIFKAQRLDKEGVASKVSSISNGINTKSGINRDNKAFEIVDSITREDISEMAKKIFKHPPVYSIVASEDTLNANAEFIENLKRF